VTQSSSLDRPTTVARLARYFFLRFAFLAVVFFAALLVFVFLFFAIVALLAIDDGSV